MFWQSADQSRTYLGVEPLKCLVGKSSAQVKNFQSQFKRRLINLTPSIDGQPVLLGGFPFDFHGRTEHLWGDLEKGYFILPQILFWQHKQNSYVTLLVRTVGDVEAKLNHLATQAANLLQERIEKRVSLPPLLTHELALPQWMQLVNDSVAAIKSQKLKKVVLARQLELFTTGMFNPTQILRRLMNQQPNTYHFLLSNGDCAFIGATPERLLKATKNSFQTASVAGSIARGKTPIADYRLGQQLLNDHKNEYEHQVVAKRIARTMAEFTDNLTIGQRQLLKNRDIQHIYHPFTGQRKRGVKLLDVLKALHPTPALGGEPRSAAMKWLAEKEPAGRGLYGGPIGWLGLVEDQGEFAVGLRSGIFKKNKGLLYAGCGIVAESQAEKERNETSLKFQPMLRGVNDKWTTKEL
ncbi:isochorismate synthase [Limosilactobacillus sp. STM2_1]|uniref:isochorismate synthase n=2 Tax=Limosilactobacillus rudii TaxID=2759755 RepID=A0A7W3UM99_9LACO|nr:isochorismate synthase [Limosilactobacillus rudii]MBB1078803.1 isochorismate synthase [Limosilactobacillus rudii]MBB1097645.1 isochorismate synthase [Limosilactobacillus rudii]